MRLLILQDNYPHQDNLLGSVFAHVRVKNYAKQHTVKAISFFHPPRTILYEGIEIEFADSEQSVLDAVLQWKPDKILVHFYQSWMLDKIFLKANVPVIIWVHLFEAIGWYRRLFNYTLFAPLFFKYVWANTKQQFQFNRLVRYSNKTGSIQFVFVSNWIRKACEQDILCRVKNKQVIPNPIDTDLFAYHEKDSGQRKKILLLRAFTSPKYANDISIETVQLLSEKPFFNDLGFLFIGKGPYFKSMTEPLKKFSNVELREGAVQHQLIPALHKEYGLFLCPTRQDSHGVSMCEAMSSGLIPLTSNNSAIPEFVTDGHSGFLTNSAADIAACIEKLYNNPAMFSQMSANAAKHARQTASLKDVLEKEMSIIES